MPSCDVAHGDCRVSALNKCHDIYLCKAFRSTAGPAFEPTQPPCRQVFNHMQQRVTKAQRQLGHSITGGPPAPKWTGATCACLPDCCRTVWTTQSTGQGQGDMLKIQPACFSMLRCPAEAVAALRQLSLWPTVASPNHHHHMVPNLALADETAPEHLSAAAAMHASANN